MIVVTGAAGFIGSCMIQKLNEVGYADVLAVDDFTRPDKQPNVDNKQLWGQVHRDNFIRWLERHHQEVDAVIHLGARTDTTEMNAAIFDTLNFEYSRALWMLCSGFQIPFLYASSAATYGLGELGYSDDHALIPQLKPLNPYGQSKQDFDVWVLENNQPNPLPPAAGQQGGKESPPFTGGLGGAYATGDQKGAPPISAPPGAAPPHWAGFKFFNVYGPNEYHKGRMASVIFHTVRQIKATGAMKLFRSHRPDFTDGGQQRDFIYVKDVVDTLLHFLEQKPVNAIYNLGTGQARTFLDLATATFRALDLEPNISFVPTPLDIRDTYQYYTQADMTKLRSAGYQNPFHALEAGIDDYVKHYLREESIW